MRKTSADPRGASSSVAVPPRRHRSEEPSAAATLIAKPAAEAAAPHGFLLCRRVVATPPDSHLPEVATFRPPRDIREALQPAFRPHPDAVERLRQLIMRLHAGFVSRLDRDSPHRRRHHIVSDDEGRNDVLIAATRTTSQRRSDQCAARVNNAAATTEKDDRAIGAAIKRPRASRRSADGSGSEEEEVERHRRQSKAAIFRGSPRGRAELIPAEGKRTGSSGRTPSSCVKGSTGSSPSSSPNRRVTIIESSPTRRTQKTDDEHDDDYCHRDEDDDESEAGSVAAGNDDANREEEGHSPPLVGTPLAARRRQLIDDVHEFELRGHRHACRAAEQLGPGHDSKRRQRPLPTVESSLLRWNLAHPDRSLTPYVYWYWRERLGLSRSVEFTRPTGGRDADDRDGDAVVGPRCRSPVAAARGATMPGQRPDEGKPVATAVENRVLKIVAGDSLAPSTFAKGRPTQAALERATLSRSLMSDFEVVRRVVPPIQRNPLTANDPPLSQVSASNPYMAPAVVKLPRSHYVDVVYIDIDLSLPPFYLTNCTDFRKGKEVVYFSYNVSGLILALVSQVSRDKAAYLLPQSKGEPGGWIKFPRVFDLPDVDGEKDPLPPPATAASSSDDNIIAPSPPPPCGRTYEALAATVRAMVREMRRSQVAPVRDDQ